MEQKKINQEQQTGQRTGIYKFTNPFSTIKNVVAIMSGKGGVGKSSVTSLLAVELNNRGYKVGVLDGDITGPSIPKLFGLREKAKGQDNVLLPVETAKGIKVMSINLLLQREEDPVVWRGPIISGVIKQFYEEVVWGDLDFLLVDLPPGTGDAPLTTMQSLPLKGLVIVSSPQQLVEMIVKKAIRMAKIINIPVLGLIENMSYIECPDCGKKIELFGPSKGEEVAQNSDITLLGKLPLIPDIAYMGDEGRIELIPHIYPDFFKEVTDRFLESIEW